jgi:hypothetical protein
MTSDDVASTELIHLTYEGNFELECTATIRNCSHRLEALETNSSTVLEVQLDRTTMHPQ